MPIISCISINIEIAQIEKGFTLAWDGVSRDSKKARFAKICNGNIFFTFTGHMTYSKELHDIL